MPCWWTAELADVHSTAIVEHGRGAGRRRVGRPLFDRRRRGCGLATASRCTATCVIGGDTTIGDGMRDLPLRQRRPAAAGPKISRRGEPPGDRHATARSASTSPSIPGRRAAGCSPASATTACSSSARMSRTIAALGNNVIAGQPCDARRPLPHRRLRDPRRPLRRAPVRAHRRKRLRRRHVGRGERHHPVRLGDRQPRRASAASTSSA